MSAKTIDAMLHEIHLEHTGQGCGCAWCANDPFCWDCEHCTELDNAPCAGDSVDGWAAWNVPCGWCMRGRAAEGVEPVPSDEELREVELWERCAEELKVAATDQTIADTGLTEPELRAWFAGWEEAYFIRSGAPEETRRMVASTRGEATMEQILDLWEQTRLEAE